MTDTLAAIGNIEKITHDRAVTAEMRQQQGSYISKSKPVTAKMVERWDWHRSLWNNAVAVKVKTP